MQEKYYTHEIFNEGGLVEYCGSVVKIQDSVGARTPSLSRNLSSPSHHSHSPPPPPCHTPSPLHNSVSRWCSQCLILRRRQKNYSSVLISRRELVTETLAAEIKKTWLKCCRISNNVLNESTQAIKLSNSKK